MAPWKAGEHHRFVPTLTFRRPAPAATTDPHAQDRERAYLLLVPLLATANLFLGLLVLVLARHSTSWKAGVLVLAGGLLCAISGWLVGVTWLRLLWRSRMERQMRLWTSVVDVVTGWEDEVGISPESALKLKRRLDALMSRF